MKKILTFLIMFLMVPLFAFADTCDTSKVTIESISINSKDADVVELSPASFNNTKINVNVQMKNVNDSIHYRFTIKNDSNEDFEFDGSNLNINSDYMVYSITSTDNNNIVKKGTSKEFFLSIMYKNQIPSSLLASGSFTEEKSYVYTLSDGKVEPNVVNPKTGDQRGIFILVMFLIGFSFIYVILNKQKYSKFFILLFALMILPVSINALCKCQLTVNSKIVVVATETPGGNTGGDNGGNTGGDDTPTTPVTPVQTGGTLINNPDNTLKLFGTHTFDKTKVELIAFIVDTRIVSVPSNGQVTLNVPAAAIGSFDVSKDNDNSVVAFYTDNDNNNKYELYIASNGTIVLPENSKNLLTGFTNATEIKGLKKLDTSNVTNMANMFHNCQKVVRMDLGGFDTSKVTDMSHMFDSCYKLEGIYVMSDNAFTTANVTSSDYMFSNCTKIKGGSGTVYDAEHINKGYARIDFTDRKGYFTGGGIIESNPIDNVIYPF